MGTQLSADSSAAARSYKDAIYGLGSLFVQRFMKVYLFPDFIYNLTSDSKELTRHVKTVHDFTERVIQKRKTYIDEHGLNIPAGDDAEEDFVYKKKKKTAMLDLLISAEKEGMIDRSGIQEEVDTFMFEVSIKT